MTLELGCVLFVSCAFVAGCIVAIRMEEQGFIGAAIVMFFTLTAVLASLAILVVFGPLRSKGLADTQDYDRAGYWPRQEHYRHFVP